VPFYRTVTHVGVSEKNHPDAEPRQRFAWAFRVGNLAASPSVPRGMSLHGARWMASAVCRVCRGGGVVASLKFDVEYDV